MRLTENEYQQGLNTVGSGKATVYEPTQQRSEFSIDQTLFSFIDIDSNECRTTCNELTKDENVYGDNVFAMFWGHINGKYFVQRRYIDGTIDYVREEMIAIITPLHTSTGVVKIKDLPLHRLNA